MQVSQASDLHVSESGYLFIRSGWLIQFKP